MSGGWEATVTARPRLLDLCCCQGGAARGYHEAGFDVYGVDLAAQPRYPYAFLQGDVVDVMRLLLDGAPLSWAHPDGSVEWLTLGDFHVVHASPPCQPYSIATAGNLGARDKYARLIPDLREQLRATGLPYVLENVQQARAHLVDPLLLCGRMFGLGAFDVDGVWLTLDRHRLFESNVPLSSPEHPTHTRSDEVVVAGVYRGSRRSSKPGATPADDRHAARYERRGGYVPRSLDVQAALLGVEPGWLSAYGMAESLPPAYTRHLGAQLLREAVVLS